MTMNDIPRSRKSRARRPTPVSSFSPELLQLLLRGGRSEIILSFPSFVLALRLRQRLYALRLALRAENHPDLIAAYRPRIYLEGKKGGPGTLRLSPADSEFRDTLERAGFAAPVLSHDPLADIEGDEK